MQKTNLKKLIKQIDRYTVSVLLSSGNRTEINAAEFLRECLINFGKKENIVNISYYKSN